MDIRKANVFELMPYRENHKSYYGKAKVIYTGFASYLVSYNTIVCSFCKGIFTRYWNGYSSTTMKHINSFRYISGLPAIGKKEWLDIPVENCSIKL